MQDTRSGRWPRLSRRAVLHSAGLALALAACAPPASTPAALLSPMATHRPSPSAAGARSPSASTATPPPAPLPTAPAVATPAVARVTSPAALVAALPTVPAPPSPSAPPVPSPTVAASSSPRGVTTPLAQQGGTPRFSDVSKRMPSDVIAYLQGRLPDYPGSGPDWAIDFSPSDILETMDTIVLDQVRQRRGDQALARIYEVIASDVLAALRDEYGDRWIVVALDAGHGGKKGFNWDPGAEGTEAEHTRAVAAAIMRLAARPENRRIIVRPIYNDAIADDFGLKPPRNRSTVNSTLMRQARASMLAAEAAAWNRAHPDPSDQVAVHEISIHFNVGAGGALVLHQGDTVRPAYAERSVDFARRYLKRVTADLNATGLLPSPLGLWNGNGLHDDVMMYRPAALSAPLSGATLRYGALQGHGYLPRFISMVLANR